MIRLLFIASLMLLFGCARIPSPKAMLPPEPGKAPAPCVEMILGDELDDFEVYSSEPCGLEGNLKPYLVLTRPKDSQTFYVLLRFVVSTRNSALRGNLRYSINGTRREAIPALRRRIEMGCRRTYCEEVRHYEMWLPWENLGAAKGAIKIRYMGDDIEKGVITEPMIQGIREVIERNPWIEVPPKIVYLESEQNI